MRMIIYVREGGGGAHEVGAKMRMIMLEEKELIKNKEPEVVMNIFEEKVDLKS